jgi:hypothetical protein
MKGSFFQSFENTPSLEVEVERSSIPWLWHKKDEFPAPLQLPGRAKLRSRKATLQVQSFEVNESELAPALSLSRGALCYSTRGPSIV